MVEIKGFLLLAPTGSGKSATIERDPFYSKCGIDGDHLIDWGFTWPSADWVSKDREHLTIILDRLRKESKCVCWFAGNNDDPSRPIHDAIGENRLPRNRVAVVILDEREHKARFDERKSKHLKKRNWDTALEHRLHLEHLIQEYKIECFASFETAKSHIARALAIPLE